VAALVVAFVAVFLGRFYLGQTSYMVEETAEEYFDDGPDIDEGFGTDQTDVPPEGCSDEDPPTC